MPLATRELELPLPSEDLWLANGSVPAARPYLQGDIFRATATNVDGLAIILTHPCSMRAGYKMRPQQTLARIEGIKPPATESQWRSKYLDYMPLPGLSHPSIGNGYPAADFRLIATVASNDLRPEDRVAALSNAGILRLQQRLAHYMTRVVIDLPTLSEVCEAVLVEADLQEEWVDAATRGEEHLAGAMLEAEKEFQAFLDRDNRRLRDRLQEAHTRPDALREIRIAIRDLGT